MLGRSRSVIPCRYVYFSDDYEADGYLEEVSDVTLYDARERNAKRSPEWRLYYPAGCVPMESMEPGDYCWVAKRTTGELLVAVAQSDSPTARKLDRLFGTQLRMDQAPPPERASQFRLFDLAGADDGDLDLADADLLMALDVAPRVKSASRLQELVDCFGGSYPLPDTFSFGEYARRVCAIEDPAQDPDGALYEWVTETNDLYFTYERHVLQPILDDHLANREHIDVDTFFGLATRFKNARFSRAGSTFEHHIAALLGYVGLLFDQPRRMPDGSKPDFILPSIQAYGDLDVDDDVLTFLAAKTTTKERWRQVVTEATRLPTKHLLTMDRELNAPVLDAMEANRVAVVIPDPIRAAYPPVLAGRVRTVAEFVAESLDRQSRAERAGVIVRQRSPMARTF